MLEIPESYNLAKQLNNTIVGKTISYVIANQSPGLGNGVLQDILYLSGIHPKRKMVDVSEDEYNKLFDVLKSTLRDMAEQGGETQRRICSETRVDIKHISVKTRHLLLV